MHTNTKRHLAVSLAFLWILSSTGIGLVVSSAREESKEESKDRSQNHGWTEVDCNKERSGALQRAIDRSRLGDTLLVLGTCNENVTVQSGKDLLTLNGGGNATINGPDAALNTVTVRGARGITVTGFTITGGRVGVAVDRGATAVVDGNTIESTGRNGITLGGWSSANSEQHDSEQRKSRDSRHGQRVWVYWFSQRRRYRCESEYHPKQRYARDQPSIFIFGPHRGKHDQRQRAKWNQRRSQAVPGDASPSNAIDANGQNGISVSENSGVNLGSDTGSRGSDSFPLQDDRLYGESGISRARRSSTPARPYIWRLIVFSRFTCPSTGPLLQRSVTAASTARMSPLQSGLEILDQGDPGGPRARAIHRCKALTVRGDCRAVVPGAGGDCLSSARKPIISDRITA